MHWRYFMPCASFPASRYSFSWCFLRGLNARKRTAASREAPSALPVKFAVRRNLFLRLGLPSTINKHENGALQKHFANRRNLKTPHLRFSVGRKHFENEACRQLWRHDNHVIFLTERWMVIAAFLNFSSVVWTEKIWCVFRAKPPFSNFSGSLWTESQTQLHVHPSNLINLI